MERLHSPEYYELAGYYDLLNEKYAPYEAESRFIEAAFERHGRRPRRILDLACGTGIHSLHFARQGYEVVGVDLSPRMLDVARRKAGEEGVAVEFVEGGLFIVDFLSQYGSEASTDWEHTDEEGVRIECVRQWSHDRARQVLQDRMTYFVTRDGETERLEGYHEWRIFYPQEMINYLEGVGLEVLGLHARWDLDAEPEGHDWAIVAGRAA